MDQPASILFSVLKLFIIPVGGGIPAGVLLAQTKGVAWPVTTILYLVSDIALALAFEPVLRLIAAVVGRISFLSRFSATFKALAARSAAHIGGTSAGPLALVMVSFGVDPMTGRATAHAAGHGFIAGCTIADRERFIRSCARLAKFRWKAILIEASYEDMKTPYHRFEDLQAEAHPNAVCGTLDAIEAKFGIPILYSSRNRDLASEKAASWLSKHFMYWWLEQNGHDRVLIDTDGI